MPSRERVDALITMVEAGRYVDALRAFYADHAATRENGEGSRVGLDVLIATEERALSAFTIATRPVNRTVDVLVDGDRVVVHWTFDIAAKDGSHAFTLDELASQRWEGDRIVDETFYYDPGQRTRNTRS